MAMPPMQICLRLKFSAYPSPHNVSGLARLRPARHPQHEHVVLWPQRLHVKLLRLVHRLLTVHMLHLQPLAHHRQQLRPRQAAPPHQRQVPSLVLQAQLRPRQAAPPHQRQVPSLVQGKLRQLQCNAAQHMMYRNPLKNEAFTTLLPPKFHETQPRRAERNVLRQEMDQPV